MSINHDGVGERERVVIEGENHYFVATRGDDGWIHFMSKVPDENKAIGRKQRIVADETCRVLTRMVNRLLGNVGRPK